VNCTDYDWKAYALGELGGKDREQAEAHANLCADCREELAGLRLTLDAMSTLREEEPPRRIAFVSDKVFEPHWWQRIWSPTFAGACVIALAVVVHAFVQPVMVDRKVDAAVAKAVLQIEASYASQNQYLQADNDLLKKQNNRMYMQETGLSHQ
jgi:hypothetical protein